MNIIWDKRFLELAKHISGWSRDPNTKVGAVIVNDEKIVIGLGYNGHPKGINDYAERYNDRETKLNLIIHSEINAILNSSQSVKNCTLYIWPTMMLPPCCPNCAKIIVQSGIKRVVCYKNEYLNIKWQDLAKYTNILFDEGGVEVTVHEI